MPPPGVKGRQLHPHTDFCKVTGTCVGVLSDGSYHQEFARTDLNDEYTKIKSSIMNSVISNIMGLVI